MKRMTGIAPSGALRSLSRLGDGRPAWLGAASVTAVLLASPAAWSAPALSPSQAPALLANHPLDGLTATELGKAKALIDSYGSREGTTFYAGLALHEPAKDFVRAWRPGQPFSRVAEGVIVRNNTLHEVLVDLTAGKVIEWTSIQGAFPRIIYASFDVTGLLKADPRWRAALSKRGLSETSKLEYLPLAPGPASDPELAGRQLVYVSLYDVSDPDTVTMGRPIEGLVGVVDIVRKEVVRVVDLGVTPPTADQGSLSYARQTPYRKAALPVEISAPQGSNVQIQGSEVRWDNWSFHLRVDPRSGPVVSLLRYDDHGAQRDVLYQAAASEMFVPYMHPAATWSWRSYMDVGEYGFGLSSTPLQAGVDCPASAKFLDAVLANDTGAPEARRSVVCIFERPTGDPIWRHNGQGRPNIELVVRMAPTVGNYDYFVDFVFDRAGQFGVNAGALGIDAVMGVASHTLSDSSAKVDTAYGTLVADGLVAPNHDHFISVRLDMDVDGVANRAVIDRIVPALTEPGNRRRSLWRVAPEPIEHAGPLKDPVAAGALRIESIGRTNAHGYPTSYQLMPAHETTSLLAPDDLLQVRATWSRYANWLSLYEPDQLYASGKYPNQNGRREGLAKWTDAAQAIDGKDVVLWTNLAFRHVPRAEDWPSMPVLWHGFKLRPVNFFDKNPAIDIPPEGAHP